MRKVNPDDFKKFLLSLSPQTLKTFNPFGAIKNTNVICIVKKELGRNDKVKFFSYVEGKLIAYSFLTKFEKSTKKHSCILGIVVGDVWQKKGLGKQICKHMIKYAWKNKFKKIWLTVFLDNMYAIKFYKHLGFEVEGVFIYDEKLMKKYRDVVSMAIFKNAGDTAPVLLSLITGEQGEINKDVREAFSKAVGMGLHMPMTWRSAQMLNAPSGKPVIVCSGALEVFMRTKRLSAQVTISDEAEYGVAFVIVTQEA